MSHCVRSITFTIPDLNGGPGVEVTVVEDDGKLIFTVGVLETSGKSADLRGLFFHVKDSALPGLTVTDTDPSITDTKIAQNAVLDLGHGANMKGAVKDGFDVGIKFGSSGIGKDDVNGPVSFTLDATSDLTLDDIAHMEFGARTTSSGSKLLVTAPAAPDAVDDDYDIFEDGQSGLDDPSTVPAGVLFDVLINDTDLDGDPLIVTEIDDAPDHGTVTIAADGKSVSYKPFEDYSGPDSFIYCISDNNGGTDFAEVSVAIEAVADIPDLDVQVQAGDAVNQIRLTVTATQTDFDSSEFIDRILTNNLDLPVGVTLAPLSVNPGTEPDQIIQEYLLTLPLDTDNDFDLTFTAVSKETSNGDEETASQTIDIVYEYNTTTTDVEFTAVDQSIWNTGTEYIFDDNRFLGLDTGEFDERIPESGGVLFAGVDGHLKLGFESNLHFEGGDIDATSNYDVTVETNYNKTTDQLLIDTSALLTDAYFSTEFAEGTYTLDFVWDFLLHAYAGVNIDFGGIDFDPLDILPGNQTLDFGGVNGQVGLTVDFGPDSFNLLSLDSNDVAGVIPFPDPLDAFQINYEWPDIVANGTLPPNPVPADGESENVLELEIDVDQLAAQVISYALGSPETINPLHPVDFHLGPIFADIDLLDIDAIGGVNLIQDFNMQLGQLTGILEFEDGSSQLFDIGESLTIDNAKVKDQNGLGLIGTANDGYVDFAFAVVPTSTLQNETALGFNIGYEIDVFKVEVGYDVSIFNPFSVIGLGDEFYHFSNSIDIGPLAGFEGSTPVGEIEIFDQTFALNFSTEEVSLFA